MAEILWREPSSVFEDLRKVVALLRKSSPGFAIASTVLTILEVGLGISVLYAIKLLIDTISAGSLAADSSGAASLIFIYLAVVGSAILLATAVNSAGSLVREVQGMRIGEFIDQALHERAVSVDLAFYESPQYFDSLQRARQAGRQRPAQMVNGLLLMVKSLCFLVAILALVVAIDWRILPAILFAVLAVLAVRLRFTRRLFEWQRERVQLERRSGYLDWLMTSDYHAKELRIGGLGGFLRSAYAELRRDINRENLKIETRKTLAEFMVAVLGAVIFSGAIAFLVFETIAGRQSVGDLVLFVLLFRRAESSGRELVTNVSQFYDNRLYLRQLFDFLSIRPKIVAPEIPQKIPSGPKYVLRFENVDFCYPGNSEPTLSNVNLTIESGQVVALIGENGSGKTSIIKLLTRLYDPDRGRVTLNGIDIRKFDPEVYRHHFSVIFQDFSKYADTVGENIRFGDVGMPYDRDRIEWAGRLAGVDDFALSLHSGYDTPLSRLFDNGQEISVGQWQRLALARAFFPASGFIVMDEPTSSIDPRAEFELFEDFAERIEGRGALVISHRLSTVRMADYTYVLDAGRIVEAGNHLELISRKGLYASLFEKQGRHYRG